MSPREKDRIAKIVVKGAIPEAGVRAIQKGVDEKMGERILHSLLLEKGGIKDGSHVRYFTREEMQEVDFRVEDLTEQSLEEGADDNYDMVQGDSDMFG